MKRLRIGALLCGLVLGLAAEPTARAEPPLVVASIKPLHSLVAGVMDGIGAPRLLLPAGASPHTYALRPSDAKALDGADLVVWIGPDLEGYLAKSLSDGKRARKTLTLLDEPSIRKYSRREGGVWSAHSPATHAHGARDPHLWLDPENARGIVAAVVRRLASIDPGNAQRYLANGSDVERTLAQLERDIAAKLAPLLSARYLVFHDGYQYFERRFGLAPAGAITIDPERQPGAGRLQSLRTKIAAGEIVCVFAEPQFAPDRVAALVQGTAARVGILDAYGADIAAGPDAYSRMLRMLSGALAGCLAG